MKTLAFLVILILIITIVYLIMNNHPAWAFLFFLCLVGIEVSQKLDKK